VAKNKTKSKVRYDVLAFLTQVRLVTTSALQFRKWQLIGNLAQANNAAAQYAAIYCA